MPEPRSSPTREATLRNHARGPILIMRADAYAARHLGGMLRKGAKPKPVMDHAREVAQLLALAHADSEVQAAGLLHDVRELAGISDSEIVHCFGERVGTIVSEVTNPAAFKLLSTHEKKRCQANLMQTASHGAQMVRMGDMTSNLRELVDNPPVGWDREKIYEYIYGDLRIAIACKEASTYLNEVFMSAYQTALNKYRLPART